MTGCGHRTERAAGGAGVVTAAAGRLTAAGGRRVEVFAGHHVVMADPEGDAFLLC
ncbi:VOC family protein [Nonomuraea sp. NPDC049152]|uniref:VOC family protein n=1 Tax=Nonomuraea sp. NPDC049152 TaxID=3154350 RepID=UPI0033E19E9E